MSLQAEPNAGHYALTELSKKNPDFITLTQNVDGMVYSFPLDKKEWSSHLSSSFPMSPRFLA